MKDGENFVIHNAISNPFDNTNSGIILFMQNSRISRPRHKFVEPLSEWPSKYRGSLNDAPLTPYESWYLDGGLTTYAEVFRHNDEKTIEVELIVENLKGSFQWPHEKSMKVLDIGCGTGRFTVMLLDRICSLTKIGCRCEADLVDINAEAFKCFSSMASNAKAAEIGVRRTLASPWRLVDNRKLLPPYDLIVADHVFYGEPLTTPMYEKLNSLTASGGIIVVTLQSKDSRMFQMREEAGVVTNSADDFEELLKNCGAKYAPLNYESRLYFDFENRVFIDWFFATTMVDTHEQNRLLKSYCLYDDDGRTYLSNRATIFLLRKG